MCPVLILKKYGLLLLIFLLPIITRGADSFSILYHEKFLSDGDTVLVSDKLNNSLLLSLTAIPKAVSAVLMARKAEITKVPGSVNMFSFGSGCWQGDDSECDTFLITDPGYLDAIYTEGTNKGISEFTYTFYNCDNTKDSLQVWAVFNGWTDIEENPVESEFTISPNPASDYIEISLERWTPSARWSPSEIKIYNSLGECVMSVGANGRSPLQRIDVSQLAAGVYFIKFAHYTITFLVGR